MSSPDVQFRLATREDLPRLEALWTELYRLQREDGMMMDVAPEGFGAWVQSLTPSLGRFSIVQLAESEGEPIGFVAGRIRHSPAHFGGVSVGFISEVFVSERARDKGVGSALLARTADWFRGQQVTRMELQVLMKNENARRLYEHLGWKEELVQMVLPLPT